MKVLVTGGAGFVGSHLVRLLAERGATVRVFDRRAVNFPNVDAIVGDICDEHVVRKAVEGCEVVYHLAANPQLWTLRKGHFDQVNYLGTKHVLEAAVAARAKRILHCSTESILTRSRQVAAIAEDQQVPMHEVIGPYCRSKWRAEQFAFQMARAGEPVVVVNPTLPIGPGDDGLSPPTQMILDCARGKRRFYVDAELNLIDVRDVAAGMIAAVERGVPGRRYLLGAENWTIRELFTWVAKAVGVGGPRWVVPYPIALTTGMISEWVADVWTKRVPAASVTGVRLTRRRMKFDASRSWDELWVTPGPVNAALEAALAWLKSRGGGGLR